MAINAMNPFEVNSLLARLIDESKQISNIRDRVADYADSLITGADGDAVYYHVYDHLQLCIENYYKPALNALNFRDGYKPYKSVLVNWLHGYGFAFYEEQESFGKWVLRPPTWHQSLNALLASKDYLGSFAAPTFADPTAQVLIADVASADSLPVPVFAPVSHVFVHPQF